jgi:hypothetical protein
MNSGRSQFSMEFNHYAPCLKSVSDDVIAKAKDEALRAAKELERGSSVRLFPTRRPAGAGGFFVSICLPQLR